MTDVPKPRKDQKQNWVDVVMTAQRIAFSVAELQPRRCLPGSAVEHQVGALGFPPGDGARGVLPIAFDEGGIAVDHEEELVNRILAHAPTPNGYQVKYASIVWYRSRLSA